MTPTPNPPALLPACPLCGDDVTEEQGFADNFGSGPYLYVSCGTCTYQADVPDHRRLSTPAEPKVSREANSALCLRLADCRQAMHDADTRGDILDEAKRAFALMGEAIDALSNPPADGDGWRAGVREILIEASETIPPDGKAAAFAALERIMRLARTMLAPPSAPLGAGGEG